MGLFSSSTTSKTTKDMSSASKWQEPYVKDAMSSAQNIFKSKQGSEWFGGPTYAGLDGLSSKAVDGIASYAPGAGAEAANRVGLTSLGLMGSSGNYLDQIGKLSTAAGADPTQANITDATAYANNPQMNAMVAAASRDVGRNLTEHMMPSIDRDAAATGGLNSSRAGVAEGIAMRGAQDSVADISANLRGAAFADGLNRAESARQANMGASGQAAGLFGTALQTGMDGARSGQEMAYSNFSKMDAAGQARQSDSQGAMDDALKRWTQNDTRDAGLLANYMNITGGQSWGENGTETKKETTNPGILQSAMGAAAMIGGFPGLGALAGGGLGSFASALPQIAPSVLSTPGLSLPTAYSLPAQRLPRLG